MITWNDLSADEQEAMNAVAAQEPNTFFTPAVKSLAQKGLIGLMTTANKPYMLTVEGGKVYAGRALLPAGEAVDVPTERLSQDYVDARQKAWDMGAAFVDYKTWLEQRLAGVEVQRDAALARAQAAEANIVEMNKVIELLQSQRDELKADRKLLQAEIARLERKLNPPEPPYGDGSP